MTQPLTREKIENWRDLLLCGSTFFTQSGIAEVNAICDLALAGLEARRRALMEAHNVCVCAECAANVEALSFPRDTDPGREEPMGEFAQVIHDNILDLREKGIITKTPSPVAPASELVERLRGKGGNTWRLSAALNEEAAAELTRKDAEIDRLQAEVIPDLNNQLAIAQIRIAELEKALDSVMTWGDDHPPSREKAYAALSPEAKDKQDDN
jgi:C-terminal processing protease CtpA/Prc